MDVQHLALLGISHIPLSGDRTVATLKVLWGNTEPKAAVLFIPASLEEEAIGTGASSPTQGDIPPKLKPRPGDTEPSRPLLKLPASPQNPSSLISFFNGPIPPEEGNKLPIDVLYLFAKPQRARTWEALPPA